MNSGLLQRQWILAQREGEEYGLKLEKEMQVNR